MKIQNRISLFFVSMLCAYTAVAQEAAAPASAAASKTYFAFDTNTILAITVAVLLFVIILLSFMLKSSIDLYRDDHMQARRMARNTINKTSLVVFFLLASVTLSIAQDGAVPTANDTPPPAPLTAYQFNSNMITIILIVSLLIEVFVILYLIKWIKFFTGIQAFEEKKRLAGKASPSILNKGGFKAWWGKINKFKPIREERELETGHEYDGIKELDNATPPWFTWSFLATIFIAIIYVWYYNSSSAMTQEEEYERSVKLAEEQIRTFMATQTNSVDENTVTMLDDAGIQAGIKIYTANCVACHGARGEGGIGPNLTDSYSIHGGSIKEVFYTVKHGVLDKGMIAWESQLSPAEIAQVSSYIISIQGTNVTGGKEPQGEPFTSTEADAPVTSPDSSGVPEPLADSGRVARLK